MTMTLTALILIIVIAGGGIWLLKKLYDKESINVPSVRAGGLSEHIAQPAAKAYCISPLEKFYYEGKRIDPRKYIVARVDGDCMSPRGIYPGNLIFVQSRNDKEMELQKGDILYIQYQRDGFNGFKIREYCGESDDQGYVTTAYYSAEGMTKLSRHKKENIKGIVKYNFSV